MKLNLKSNKFFLGILSVLIIYIVLFPVIGYLKDFLQFIGLIANENQSFIWDSVLSFTFLLSFYSYLYLKKPENALFIIFFSALIMFLHWGFFGKVFFHGLNPYYPKWYAINVGINDLVAALIVAIFFKAYNKSLNQDATSVAPIS